MIRPRKDSPGPHAEQRIITAFWALLETRGYEAITVALLSRTAHVSPNTLYYHFQGIEDVAVAAFNGVLSRELVMKVLNADVKGLKQILDEDESLVVRFHRVSLFAASRSAELETIFADSITGIWLSTLNISRDDLDEEERLDIAFCISGLQRALASAGGGTAQFESFFHRPLGRGVLATFAQLKQRHTT